MQNSRMINIKVNLQIYNYTVTHDRGIKNHLADVLSRRLVWLHPDHTLGPDEGLDLDDGDDFAMRVMEGKPTSLETTPFSRNLKV